MKQDSEVVAASHLLEQLHQHEVVVVREVRFLEHRGQLKLVGRHLVVTRGHGDAQLVGLHFKVLHEGGHALGDGAEVVVVQLLPLRRCSTKQGTSSHRQVGTGGVQRLVNQEVLLLPAQGRVDLGDVLVKILAHGSRRGINGRQGLQQRRLVVQGVSCVADEHRGNAQRFSPHKGRRRGIPQRVPPGLKRVANAPAWERRGIGFLLDQEGSVKLFDGAPIRSGCNEAVMLLRRASSQGLEPVGVVGGPTADGPFFHG